MSAAGLGLGEGMGVAEVALWGGVDTCRSARAARGSHITQAPPTVLSTCQSGRWECTKFMCHGTCSIYGSGHYVTFDGRHYDFDGHCSYVAVQVSCGHHCGPCSAVLGYSRPRGGRD